MSALFSPITLRGLTLPNRIVVSPMCQYSAVRGEATSWHLVHLGHLALSGAGMLCIEATAVEPEGRITPGDLGLWDDATEAALKPVLAVIRQYSKIRVTIQLAHAGRKASCRVPWEGGRLIPSSEGGWITASSGGISPMQRIPVKPGYQVPFARRVKEATGATTIAVGMITEPQQAQDIVASESANMVALARGMLYDPRWPWHAAAQLGGTLEAPPQYWRALPHEHKTIFGDTST